MSLLVDIAFLFVLIRACVWLWKHFHVKQLNLPPGNVGLPIIGETISFLRTAPSGKFYRDREQKYGPIFKTSILGLKTVYVSGPEAMHQLFHMENNGLISWWPPSMQKLLGEGSVGAAPAELHHNRKKAIVHALKKVDYKQICDQLREIVNSELCGWAEKERFEVHCNAKFLSIRCACVSLLGLNLTREEVGKVATLLKGFEDGLFTVPINLPGTTYYKAVQSKVELYDFLDHKFQEQSTNTSILNSTGWSKDIMADAITELLFGAQETLSSFMTCSMLLLNKHPEVLQKLQTSHSDDKYWSETTYIDCVAKETLRLFPPIAGGFRITTKDIQLAVSENYLYKNNSLQPHLIFKNYAIPKSWGVTYSIRSTHEQSPFFDDQDSFNPDQWLHLSGRLPQFHYIPFGGGAHACVGRDYARVIWRLFLTTLTRKYTWDLVSRDPVLLLLPVVRPEGGMWVRLNLFAEERVHPDDVS